jgi:ubiquinone biosynthesis monooxygenase Coq7
LSGHLARLPAEDLRTRQIIEQMRDDEAKHAAMAKRAGAASLPPPVKKLMSAVAKVMTATAYKV